MNLQQLLKKIGKIPGINQIVQHVLNTVVGVVKSLLSKAKTMPPAPIAHMAGDPHPSSALTPHATQEATPLTKQPNSTTQNVHPTADTRLDFASQKHAYLDGDRIFRPDSLSPLANPLHFLVDPEAQKVKRMLEQMPGIVDSALRSSRSSQDAFNFLLAKPISLSSEILDEIIRQHRVAQQADWVSVSPHGPLPLSDLTSANQPASSPPAQTKPDITLDPAKLDYSPLFTLKIGPVPGIPSNTVGAEYQISGTVPKGTSMTWWEMDPVLDKNKKPALDESGKPILQKVAKSTIPTSYNSCGSLAVNAIINAMLLSKDPKATPKDAATIFIDFIQATYKLGTPGQDPQDRQTLIATAQDYGISSVVLSYDKVPVPHDDKFVKTLDAENAELKREDPTYAYKKPDTLAISAYNTVNRQLNGNVPVVMLVTVNKKTGKLGNASTDVGHWVVITGISTPFDEDTGSTRRVRNFSQNDQYVRVYNPMTNNVEYYKWGDLWASGQNAVPTGVSPLFVGFGEKKQR